jgi:hypothetical protein
MCESRIFVGGMMKKELCRVCILPVCEPESNCGTGRLAVASACAEMGDGDWTRIAGEYRPNEVWVTGNTESVARIDEYSSSVVPSGSSRRSASRHLYVTYPNLAGNLGGTDMHLSTCPRGASSDMLLRAL